MADSVEGRGEGVDELLALQRAARIRNLFHSVRRLLAGATALSHDLGLAPPSFAEISRDTPAEFFAISSSPSSTRLLELSETLRSLYDRASARVEVLYQASDLLAAGTANLKAGRPHQAVASFREAARLVPDSTMVAAALARSEEALQTTFEFASTAPPGDNGDEPDRRANEGLVRARALAESGSLAIAIRLLRDLATELPARPDLLDELERLRGMERDAIATSSGENFDWPAAVPAQESAPEGRANSPGTPVAIGTPTRAHVIEQPVIEIPLTVDPKDPTPPVWSHRGLVAVTVVLCVAAAFWALRGRPQASPQRPANVARSTPAAPSPDALPSSPVAPPPKVEPSPSSSVLVVPTDRTAQPASGVNVARSANRAATPIGTSSRRAPASEGPTSTVGDARLLAGKRPEETLLGWRIRSKELERQYAEGQDALNRSDLSRAIAVFSAIIAADPGYADAVGLLNEARQKRQADVKHLIDEADRLRQSGDYQGAIAQYQAVLEIEPSAPEIASRLSDTQRQIRDLGEQAFRRATVAYAYGLDAEARASYAVAARMLPAQNPDRAVAEARATGETAPGWPSLQTSPLDLANVVGDLKPYRDPTGRFAFDYPARQWKVIGGMGSTLVSVSNAHGASIRIDAVRLNDSLSMPEQAESIAVVETRLLEQRQGDVTEIIVRKPRPAVPLVIIDYKQQGSNGLERVRQYSCIRGRDLFRIVAFAPMDVFPHVEGVFDQLARSFRPPPVR